MIKGIQLKKIIDKLLKARSKLIKNQCYEEANYFMKAIENLQSAQTHFNNFNSKTQSEHNTVMSVTLDVKAKEVFKCVDCDHRGARSDFNGDFKPEISGGYCFDCPECKSDNIKCTYSLLPRM